MILQPGGLHCTFRSHSNNNMLITRIVISSRRKSERQGVSQNLPMRESQRESQSKRAMFPALAHHVCEALKNVCHSMSKEVTPCGALMHALPHALTACVLPRAR